jgi:hypothetical protein
MFGNPKKAFVKHAPTNPAKTTKIEFEMPAKSTTGGWLIWCYVVISNMQMRRFLNYANAPVFSNMQMRPFSQLCKCGRFLNYANVGVFSTMQMKNK